jgi:hypothetical protein
MQPLNFVHFWNSQKANVNNVNKSPNRRKFTQYGRPAANRHFAKTLDRSKVEIMIWEYFRPVALARRGLVVSSSPPAEI